MNQEFIYIIFQNIKYFTLISQYMFPFLFLMVNNKDKFRMNSETGSVPGLILISIKLCHI
jgi:hypothetical protein